MQNSFPDAKQNQYLPKWSGSLRSKSPFVKNWFCFFLLLNCLVIFVQHDYPRVFVLYPVILL